MFAKVNTEDFIPHIYEFVLSMLEADFPGGSVVKNLPANARDTGDMSLTPGLGRSLEKEIATHSGILGLEKKKSWIEEPGKLQSVGSQRVVHD